MTGRRVRLRPAGQADLPRFREILGRPEVARWWGDPNEQAEEACAPPEDIRSYAIEYEGTVVGIIQSCEEPTPDYRHAGLDIAVQPGWHRRAFAAPATPALCRNLKDGDRRLRLTTDPAAGNEAAIRLFGRL